MWKQKEETKGTDYETRLHHPVILTTSILSNASIYSSEMKKSLSQWINAEYPGLSGELARGAIKMINHGSRGKKFFFSHQKDGAHESVRNKLTKFCLKICSFYSKQVFSNKKWKITTDQAKEVLWRIFQTAFRWLKGYPTHSPKSHSFPKMSANLTSFQRQSHHKYTREKFPWCQLHTKTPLT